MLVELEAVDGSKVCINPKYVAAVRPHDPGTVGIWCNAIPYALAIVKGDVSEIALELSIPD